MGRLPLSPYPNILQEHHLPALRGCEPLSRPPHLPRLLQSQLQTHFLLPAIRRRFPNRRAHDSIAPANRRIARRTVLPIPPAQTPPNRPPGSCRAPAFSALSLFFQRQLSCQRASCSQLWFSPRPFY